MNSKTLKIAGSISAAIGIIIFFFTDYSMAGTMTTFLMLPHNW
jgi:hypothetical protein